MNSTSAPAPSAGDWEELVTTALLGTDRRTPPGHEPGQDAPVALLDAAAVETVRRRAGLCPARAAERPEPAAPDARPTLPVAAARRLAMLLADRPGAGGGGRRGTSPDLMELLPQWLTAANARGFAAPVQALPALLDAARGRTDLRPAALEFAGPRALWLARMNADWRFALRATPGGGTALPDLDDPDRVQQLWQEGLFAERVALLAAIRAHRPAAARELLATTWATERAEDRLMFLDSLRMGLAAEDEPFLEEALADRSRNVRSTAAELLSALPDSALAARMAVRASACVAVDRTREEPALVVEAPHECDSGMERDGVVAKAPAGRGERSWWLGQLVEATPLGTWERRLGGRTPREIVALPVADDWRGELHAAWCRAAARQRNAEWSRALLGVPSAPEAGGPGAVSLAERAKLLGTLGRGERAEWVAGFIAAQGLSEAFQLLGVCAVPWAAPLGRAVVDALNIARDAGSYPWSFSGVMGLAERCLDPAEASRLDGLLAVPDETEDAAPGAGAIGRRRFSGWSRRCGCGRRWPRSWGRRRERGVAPPDPLRPEDHLCRDVVLRPGRLPHVLPHPVHDRLCGRPGGEDLRDALLLQRGDVRLGDDPTAEDQDVLGLALLEQVDHGGEERVVGAGEDGETDRVGVLLDRGVDDLLGGLVKAGVDDLHAGVAQGPRDHLGPAIMAVEPRLGHHHADRTGCHTHHCLHEATAFIPTNGYRGTRSGTGSERTLSPASRNRQFRGGYRGEITRWDKFTAQRSSGNKRNGSRNEVAAPPRRRPRVVVVRHIGAGTKARRAGTARQREASPPTDRAPRHVTGVSHATRRTHPRVPLAHRR